MAFEQQTAQTIASQTQTMAQIFIKASDIPFILKSRTPDEIRDYVERGGQLSDHVFEIPYTMEGEVRAALKAEGIPVHELIIGKNGSLNPDVVTFNFQTRDIDTDKAFEIVNDITKRYELKREFKITPDDLNKYFDEINTNLFEGLTREEADLLQDKLAKYKVHSAMFVNLDEKTFGLEIATSDVAKEQGKCNDVEKAITEMVLEKTYPAVRDFDLQMESKREEAAKYIKDEWDKQRAIDQKIIIQDAVNPERRMEIYHGQVHLKSGENKGENFDLDSDEARIKYIDMLEAFQAPIVTNKESEIPELSEKLFNDYNIIQETKLNIEKAAEELIEKELVEAVVDIEKDHENGAREFRLENNNEVKEIIGKIPPANGKESDLNFDDNIEELRKDANVFFKSIMVSQSEEHVPMEKKVKSRISIDMDDAENPEKFEKTDYENFIHEEEIEEKPEREEFEAGEGVELGEVEVEIEEPDEDEWDFDLGD